MRNPTERLKDILDAVANIERYSVRGREVFEQDELVRTWVLYHLQIIGEAAAQLGKAFHAAHPEVPWAQIVAMRNVLVHAYFGVDLNEVWRTVESDLPTLKQQIVAIINQLQTQGGSE